MISVQMWNNRKPTYLEGNFCYISNAPAGFSFIMCQEESDVFSVVCVECGLRVCSMETKLKAENKCHLIFQLHNKNNNLAAYMQYTAEAYHAYLAYIWARAGMYAHTPSQLLSVPRFPLFNHHRMEDV